MHVIMEEELMRVRCTSGNANAGPSTSTREEPQRETENTAEWEDWWRRAIRRCCERMDEVAVSTCACGSVGCDCAAHSMEVALSGSTAVVALLTSEHIIVANCGDSRAALAAAALVVVGVLVAVARPSDPWLIPGVLLIGAALAVALYGPGRWW